MGFSMRITKDLRSIDERMDAKAIVLSSYAYYDVMCEWQGKEKLS